MALDTIPKQEGGKLKAVASGTLPSGQPVIVNSDGTVSVVEGTAEALSSPAVFNSGNTLYNSVTFDSNSNKIVMVYADTSNSSYGTAIVGTVSGNTISFGTEVVFQSVSSQYIAVTFDSNSNKVVIAYGNVTSSGRGTAVVGTVSGTSISFGTPVVFETGDSDYIATAFDSSNNKVVISYRDAGDSGYGKAVVGTVSGTAISFGSIATFESASTFYTTATFDSTSNKVVIAYTDGGNSTYGTAVVGTVSGTGISFGTPVVWQSKAGTRPSAVFDSTSNKVVIAYYTSTGTQGEAVVCTVSGTSISFGAIAVFNTGNVGVQDMRASFDSTNNKIVVAYQDAGDSNLGKLTVGTVSGTSISFDPSVVFETGATYFIGSAFDSNAGKTVISYADYGAGPDGTVVVFQNASTTLTSENYIGMSTGGTVADTGNATIDIVGTVNKEQSGLTAGQQYYVQIDGTIGTTPADPSVLAGTAVSATKMVVKS